MERLESVAHALEHINQAVVSPGIQLPTQV